MSDYLQEIESEYIRIRRGRRGLLKPLDWDLASKWESAGFPLPVVLRTMAEVGDRFYREAKDGDQINSLRYFDPAVRRAAGKHLANQVGRYASEDVIEDTSVRARLLELAAQVRKIAGRIDVSHPVAIDKVAGQIEQLAISSDSMDFLTIEGELKTLDCHFQDALKLSCSNAQVDAFNAAGTSSDPYLRNAQIANSVRAHFECPELTLLPE